ncbi:MAG: hypothetical protein AAFU73_16280 [Planctomycetota bacterium]
MPDDPERRQRARGSRGVTEGAEPAVRHGSYRPTFERQVPGVDARTLAGRLREALESTLPFRRTESHFLVWLPDVERRLWSPWLHLDLLDTDDAERGSDACRIFGRFHPAPSLWTALMLGNLALGVLLAGGLLFAWSQSMAGEEPWGIWIAVAAALGLVATLVVSRVGQARARGQIARLVDVVDRCAGV